MVSANGQTAFDLSVYGPNGFLRALKGSIAGRDKANLVIKSVYHVDHLGITLDIQNRGAAISKIRILNDYSQETVAHRIEPGEHLTRRWPLVHTFGWYDFTVAVDSDPTFEQRLAGHVETGDDSMSDPAIGAR